MRFRYTAQAGLEFLGSSPWPFGGHGRLSDKGLFGGGCRNWGSQRAARHRESSQMEGEQMPRGQETGSPVGNKQPRGCGGDMSRRADTGSVALYGGDPRGTGQTFIVHRPPSLNPEQSGLFPVVSWAPPQPTHRDLRTVDVPGTRACVPGTTVPLPLQRKLGVPGLAPTNCRLGCPQPQGPCLSPSSSQALTHPIFVQGGEGPPQPFPSCLPQRVPVTSLLLSPPLPAPVPTCTPHPCFLTSVPSLPLARCLPVRAGCLVV